MNILREMTLGARTSRALLLGGLAGWALEAGAASLGTETFGSQQNWTDRDVAEMSVSYNASIGDGGAGSLQGSFLAQGAQSPESDAFRASALAGSSGGMFTGNYWDIAPFAGWTFSFMSDDVLPSDLIVRFSNGTDLFLRSVLDQVTTGLDNWYTVTVPLTYAGWLGGSATAFSNALNNVTFVDVQVTRNGTGAQDFFLDNFTLTNDSGAFASVPEPSTAGLLLASVAVLRAARRRGSRARQALAALWGSGGGAPAPVPADARPADPIQPVRRRGKSRRRQRKEKIQLIY